MTDLTQAIAGLTPEQLQLLQKKLGKRTGAAEGAPPRPAIPLRPRDTDRFPPSPAQQRFWFLDRLQPGSGDFNIPVAARLRGALDPVALARALAAVIARHEVLRTAFVDVDGRPFQVIGGAAAPALPVVDLAALPEAARGRETERLAAAEARAPFDLGRGPLLRLSLLRLGPVEHVALLTFHHAVADRWSVGLFFGELMAAYDALRAGRPSLLPPLPLQYADYACWQRERLEEGGLLDRQLAYWKERLAGAPAAIDLPTDVRRPKGNRTSVRQGHLPLAVDARLADALRAVGRSAEASLSMVLLAAFAALLRRWTGEEDVVVGSPIANRGRHGVQELIGPFANDLVLRADVSGDPAFRELLARVRSTVLGAYEHADVPFEKLVEALAPEREPGRNPLAQVFFVLENVPMPSGGPAGLEVSLLEVERPAGQFDLLAFLGEGPEGVTGSLFYDAELFERETLRLFAESFAAFLERAAAEPDVRLSALPLAGELEARAAAARRRDEPLEVVLTATFTADLAAEPMAAWLEELDMPARIEVAPYGQVFQQLLDPASLAGRNARGANLVLFSFEDWERHGGGDAERSAAELADALRSAAARSAAFHLAVACPPSPAWERRHGDLEARLAEALAGSGVSFVPASEILGLYPVAAPHDPHADELGHVPYTPAFFAALGTFLARKVAARRAVPIKAVAIDCDNTLWAGVCGEDGPRGVRIDAARRAFQEELVRLHGAGVLICLLSKNEEEDVDAVFAAYPDMPLRPEHVVARRIDWSPKSANLRTLAAELGLAIDAFALVDDNPVECAEVRAGCPGALVLRLPEGEAEIAGFLRHVWALDRLETTAEDRKRTDLYRQNAERERFRGRTASFADFLAGLGLEVAVSAVEPRHLARAAQLTVRTNQFNASTVRRTEGELRDFLATGEGRIVEVRDRFGDYGLVGLALFRAAGTALEVDTLLLSCRVLGKGVEHRVLAELGRLAAERGLAEVAVPFRRTERNRPVLDFLESTGARWREGDVYRFPATEAAAATFAPVEAPAPVAEMEPEAVPVRAVPRRAFAERSDAEEILAWVRSRKAAARAETAEYVPPRTPIEELLAEVWMELLAVDRVGAHDSFFRLGGHSLLGTVLLSRVRDAFEVEIPLFTLFEAPTLGGLAARIEEALLRDAGASEIAEGLAELEGLSDEEVRALLEAEASELESAR